MSNKDDITNENMSTNTDNYYEHKLSLIKLGFFYNPVHETFQKIKYSTEQSKCFYNAVFHPEDNELWITNTVHNLQDDAKYYMYILYLGKIPKTVDMFNSIVHTVTTINRVVNNDMVRHLRSTLEKHQYVQTVQKNHETEYKGEIKSFFEYKYEKQVSNFILSCDIELPSNKMYFVLANEKENIKTSILDCHIPQTIIELNIILNNIPIILHSYFE